jgi:protein tyrosine/serine phosphatase
MGFSAHLPKVSAIAVALTAMLSASVQARSSTVTASDLRISNCGRVNDQYYRGAQPKGRDYADLAAFGVKTIVDLRNDAQGFAPSLAKQAGLNYVVISLSGWERPDDAAVTRFLAVVNDAANQPVYVHCQVGKHRTGAMTAVYRMTQDGWNATRAYTEMKQYRFKSFFTPHTDLKDFVFEYYTQLDGAAAAASKSHGPSR